ncbi:unnamed protein product [Pedinophyceae sp. YPF-701]|nr:unnamed protein product [Pedinophyceae sp. YPF-701]
MGGERGRGGAPATPQAAPAFQDLIQFSPGSGAEAPARKSQQAREHSPFQTPGAPRGPASDGAASVASSKQDARHGAEAPHPASRYMESAARRRLLADWIFTLTGHEVPTVSDQLFRRSLRSGEVLCYLAEALRPGSVPHVTAGPFGTHEEEEQAARANLATFCAAAVTMGLPEEMLFRMADLEGPGYAERPVVLDCLWELQRLDEEDNAPTNPDAQSPDDGSRGSSDDRHDNSPRSRSKSPHPRTPSPRGRAGSYAPAMASISELPPRPGGPPGTAASAPRSVPVATTPAPATPYEPSSPGKRAVQSLEKAVNDMRASQHTPATVGPPPRLATFDGAVSLDSDGVNDARAGLEPGMPAPEMCASPRALRDREGSASHTGASGARPPLERSPSANTAGMRRSMLFRRSTSLRDSMERRMWTPQGAGSLGSMDGLGPVMEQVITTLTKEYELKIADREHAVKDLQGQLDDLRERMVELEAGGGGGVSAGAARRPASAAAAARAASAAAPVDAAQVERAAEMRARQAALAAGLDAVTGEMCALKHALTSLQSWARDEAARLGRDLREASGAVASMALAASGYARAMAENRRLYNTIQDLRGQIRVMCRVRPVGTTGDPSEAVVHMQPSARPGEVLPEMVVSNPTTRGMKAFAFDQVFGPESTQEGVYAEIAPLVRSVMDGYNVCIFAYGQTGSGKTHTMSGPKGTVAGSPERGVNWRALDDLFALKETRAREMVYEISVQMLEIYNEQVRDLLSPEEAGGAQASRLPIRKAHKSGQNVPDATRVVVSSTEDVAVVMAAGEGARSFGETRMNERSSRSHCVVMVIVEGTNLVSNATSHACLNLIDLAGSERLGRSEAQGDRLRETQNINRSLSALGDVISALAAKQGHVPYRNSKLTHLLQDSLAGQAKTMMLMHVAPESSSHQETLSTCQFGTRVASVTLGRAGSNAGDGSAALLRQTLARAEEDLRDQREDNKQLKLKLKEERERARRLEAEVQRSAQIALKASEAAAAAKRLSSGATSARAALSRTTTSAGAPPRTITFGPRPTPRGAHGHAHGHGELKDPWGVDPEDTAHSDTSSVRSSSLERGSDVMEMPSVDVPARPVDSGASRSYGRGRPATADPAPGRTAPRVPKLALHGAMLGSEGPKSGGRPGSGGRPMSARGRGRTPRDTNTPGSVTGPAPQSVRVFRTRTDVSAQLSSRAAAQSARNRATQPAVAASAITPRGMPDSSARAIQQHVQRVKSARRVGAPTPAEVDVNLGVPVGAEHHEGGPRRVSSARGRLDSLQTYDAGARTLRGRSGRWSPGPAYRTTQPMRQFM